MLKSEGYKWKTPNFTPKENDFVTVDNAHEGDVALIDLTVRVVLKYKDDLVEGWDEEGNAIYTSGWVMCVIPEEVFLQDHHKPIRIGHAMIEKSKAQSETPDEYLNRLIEEAKPTMQEITDPEKHLAEIRGHEDEAKGVFEVCENTPDVFRFRLRDKNGLTIFTSFSSPNYAACLEMVNQFKEAVTDESRFNKFIDKNGCYFRVLFENGASIGWSDSHLSEKSLDKTIEAVKAITPTAEITYVKGL